MYIYIYTNEYIALLPAPILFHHIVALPNASSASFCVWQQHSAIKGRCATLASNQYGDMV